MPITGTVTDIFTEGYAEVMLQEDVPPLQRRYVAENSEKVRRGDTVELEPAEPWNDRLARLAYLMPIAVLILGVLLPQRSSWPDRLIIGGVLGLLSFAVAWLMNRRARLRRRLAWRVRRVISRPEREFGI